MHQLNKVFDSIKKDHPITYWVIILHFLGALLCMLLLVVDNRVLMGVSLWLKPMKFFFSVGIYLLTVTYLIRFYPYSDRKRSWIIGISTWTLFIEMMVIFVQAIRGVQSHYNISSPIDGILFGTMGLMIGINVLIMVLFIIDTARLKINLSTTMQLSIFMGWIIIFFGSWVGGQMIAQVSHSIGVADGGSGLPLVNWSTIAGDLRIAHFFGIHGIQVIPLFAFWISKKSRIPIRNQVIVVCLFGLSYASWIAFTFYQAKQGMPLISL